MPVDIIIADLKNSYWPGITSALVTKSIILSITERLGTLEKHVYSCSRPKFKVHILSLTRYNLS